MPELRDRIRVPRAGWQGIALLWVMVLALSWSVQGPAWLERMDYLVPLGLIAVLAGTLVGMVRWSIVVTLPLGALIGATVLVWLVGGEYHTALGGLERLFALRQDLIALQTRNIFDQAGDEVARPLNSRAATAGFFRMPESEGAKVVRPGLTQTPESFGEGIDLSRQEPSFHRFDQFRLSGRADS